MTFPDTVGYCSYCRGDPGPCLSVLSLWQSCLPYLCAFWLSLLQRAREGNTQSEKPRAHNPFSTLVPCACRALDTTFLLLTGNLSLFSSTTAHLHSCKICLRHTGWSERFINGLRVKCTSEDRDASELNKTTHKAIFMHTCLKYGH